MRLCEKSGDEEPELIITCVRCRGERRETRREESEESEEESREEKTIQGKRKVDSRSRGAGAAADSPPASDCNLPSQR